MQMMRFTDRREAGRALGVELAQIPELRSGPVVVVGLPRGGVPVAAEVAAALGAPLDVIVVRKLGVPGHEEYAMGAIGEGGVRVLDESVVRAVGATSEQVARVEQQERAELERRVQLFRGDRPPVSLAGATVIVVDDGIATGSTALAACRVARAHGADRVVMAVPVAPAGWEAMFARDADATIAVATPGHFQSVGQWYRDFTQTSDAEVTRLLHPS
jgi:predicted phosphoribosyltransferase